jgi:hypothetical protein
MAAKVRRRRSKLMRAYPLLRSIATAKPHVRQAMLYHLDPNGVRAVSDIVLRGLSSRRYKKKVDPIKESLQPDSRRLKYICRKKCCERKRKEKIVQSGGSISLILAAVLPLLVNLIFGKKK